MDTKVIDEGGMLEPSDGTTELKTISSVEESVDEIFDVCKDSEATYDHHAKVNEELTNQDEIMKKMNQISLETNNSSELNFEDVKLEENLIENNPSNQEEDEVEVTAEVAKEDIPQSKSIEFTYTTFGSSERTDSSDESAPRTETELVVTNKKSVTEDVVNSKEVVEEKIKENAEFINEGIDKNSQICSDKKPIINIDEFIEQVKQDQVSNKDACNYMLNLLVSGEFDLEKNFIIQNVNNILNLIQVIKCAKLSLKVKKII